MLIKLLVGALAVLLVLLVGLLWLVAILAKITLWLPGAVTALFVLSAIGALLYRRYRAKGAARGLEQALASQAKQQAKVVRPDLQLELQQMQEEFDKAVDALKSSKLGGRGREALYMLPWYSIIGPPGAGKSTALRNSGLQFPYSSGTGDPSVKGLGGTRNCDWWLTNEAVVLDTAGRWSTQEEDHDEWLSFLALLKQYRPKKPLNGLITAISIGDLVNVHEDEVEALAQRMRERLDEVQAQLSVSIPVYVLFTKCDLVEGFLETFRGLSRTERAAVWGFTVPMASATGEPGAYFDGRFDQLADVLERRSLSRMAEERRVDTRTKAYAFPQQFMILRRNLSRFIGVMFQENIYQQTPTFRGAYFTSGTQEGRPFNLLMNRLAESMGVRRSEETTENPVDQKSYFLHDLFMNVIFEDRDVASASEVELRRQKVRRRLVTGVMFAAAFAIGLVPSYAWTLNRQQLSWIETAVEDWEKPEQAKLAETESLERLEPLRKQVDTLVDYEREGAPVGMTFGMYQADELVPHLRRYYANLLRRVLVQPVVAHDVEAMTDFGFRFESLPNARPTPEEHAAFYDVLKLHLYLTAPKSEGEPPFGEAESDWVREQLQARWARQAGDNALLGEAARVNAELYVAFLDEFDDLAFTRDKEVIRRVRDALNRVPATERALERLILLAESEGYELSLGRLIGAAGAVKGTGKVRGAFTRRGFDNVVRDLMTPAILQDAGELWVLGLADDAEQRTEQRAMQLEELRTAYFKGYVEEWQNFLRSLRVNPPPDHNSALALLRELSRGTPPPLSLLLQKVHYNVQLKPKPSADGALKAAAAGGMDRLKRKLDGLLGEEQAAKAKKGVEAAATRRRNPSALVERDVARAFEGFTAFGVPPDTGDEGPRPSVPLDSYQEQLYYVRDALQMHMDNPEESEQLLSRLQAARVRVQALVQEQQVGWRPLFEALLWPPIEGAAASSSLAIAKSANRSWCNDVVMETDRTLKGHFPFDRNGQDLPLDDFSEFYKPGEGRLWAFSKDVLGNTVELDGEEFLFAKALGKDGSSIYTSGLLRYLNASRELTTSFFPSGASEPQVVFEVRVHPSPYVATTQFSVGGRTVEHHNGPERWKSLVWPGEKPEAGAAIVIRGANGMHERIRQDGSWGLFRLLEAGSVVRGAGRTFTVAWQLQTHDVTLQVDIRTKRGESPFFGVPGRAEHPKFMHPVRSKAVVVPRKIVHDGRACKQ